MIELSPRQHKQYEIHATDRNIIIWLYNEIEFDVLSVTMYCTDISHNPIPLSESNYWNIIRSVVWWGFIPTRYTNIHILYGNECSVFPCTLHATEPSIGAMEYTTTPFGLSYVHPSTCEHSSCMGFALHFFCLSKCIDMIFECELILWALILVLQEHGSERRWMIDCLLLFSGVGWSLCVHFFIVDCMVCIGFWLSSIVAFLVQE